MHKITLGVDVGSTTIKLVALENDDTIVYKKYIRHHSNINGTLVKLIKDFVEQTGYNEVSFNITGSAGLGLAKKYDLSFVQEVSCAYLAVSHQYEDVDVIIELGGEDAKVIFIDKGNVEQRMNGTCAGGTGAFIDQMAQLLKVEASELNELAKDYEKIYDISSRCGVFAKSDVQPLLNQGARKADIAVSIYQAIVNQTIIGLAQGREIKGKVCFLGGPLTFSDQLRERYIETLNLKESFIPEDAEVFVAYGCALYPDSKQVHLDQLIDRLVEVPEQDQANFLQPIFSSDAEYQAFLKRHDHDVKRGDLATYQGKLYIGIDAGSTTTKIAVIGDDNELLHEYYAPNQGNPLDLVSAQLIKIYETKHPQATIKGVYATGYGEQLMKNAFSLDGGQVETICHFEAAKFFLPDVEFVLDIGGQDMKYFQVEKGVISNIVLNEACSSGCGSFISTYAESLGYDVKEFAKIALKAQHPLNLGMRCTVFMNSGIKQALAMQAKVEDISASLAISVVKNALYKVIRATNFKEDFGTKVLVQGGTFYNDAILKAFEDEIGLPVIRPKIAGVMGAFGAALIAKQKQKATSSILSYEELKNFNYQATSVTCQLCPNHCNLTINTFSNQQKFIANNRCSKPLKAQSKQAAEKLANMYQFKLGLLERYINEQPAFEHQIGLVRALNMYENIPFWIGFFNHLHHQVVVSDKTSQALIKKGQHTIPSDTVCYPAKLVHGHIKNLEEKGVATIFYPNMPYNEMESANLQNHYNCPVVGCYPELINANIKFDKTTFLQPYLALNNVKEFTKVMYKELAPLMTGLTKSKIKQAYQKGLAHLQAYRQDILAEGQKVLADVIAHHKPAIVLAGRPYHIDEEINHGIDKLITDLGCTVLSEDSFAINDDNATNVLNQWTYHNRMYNAAHSILEHPNINLVQFVSFGCGIDAITADEVKAILASKDKLYTQLKIDDISNVGSASIRLRSLINVME